MAKRSIDRRVARTRAMLQQAHIALTLEKGYEAITIEDICDSQCRSIDILRPLHEQGRFKAEFEQEVKLFCLPRNANLAYRQLVAFFQ